MSPNPQWDVPRALRVARLFHLVCGVRDACVTPFLTLYLRQLGVAAPLVGILMGTKHLIATCWIPFCAFLAKRYQKRRMFLTGSLLSSAGASLLMVLVPPVDRNLVNHFCNGSSRVATTILPLGVTQTVIMTPTQGSGAPNLPGSRHTRALDTSGFPNGSEGTFSGLQTYLVGSVEGARTTTQGLHLVTSGLRDNSQKGTFEVGNVTLNLLPGSTALGGPVNLSKPQGDTQTPDHSSKGSPWTFILSLGVVVFWELLAAPLEQVADDSLYEYLDFVDATDRNRDLWVWKLLGVSAGVCGIAALVGHLECLLVANGPQGVIYFYSYSLVSTLALAVSTAFPVPIDQQQGPSYKAIKALSLIRGDSRLILLAFTVFWIGATASTVQDFLFWHMKDHGSSELVMGFSVALSLLGEILFHPFRTSLLRKLSRVGVLGLGLGCLALQVLYYAFIWSWWSVLPVQILSTISSGALWWAVGASIEDLAFSGMERSLGTMFRGHFYGSGCSLGSFVGGFVVLHFGIAVLYEACCVVLLLWLALFLSIQPRLPQEQRINYSKLLAMGGSDSSDSEQGSEGDWLVKAMREEHSDWKG
ncbi:major facilitator superfamily domain-containing protein 6-like [Mus musculus]|jgi:MFS family permease|uniref:Major facilitator superfamily domain-containing protein 6-like n=1 Tax=Mus musculus TaxID=10090 RepID=MFS6L_MOUSE|nr:major facilitator superfamily domain-containing protein 6-like [Mus musculus]Q8R3N2.1 RecName: Full=Major facilitator superfamily domain-containing protein 6-like [Mus musculus]AAH24997.1 Major facilitator superfamily domain containing 6-like [Mus musculus]EDL10450.1 cDNA sequence BC024997 [Mus musculus]|eukprot:NP_666116.1 major facilitator superfamily domain-containing protein 6-like [Mus musculus]